MAAVVRCTNENKKLSAAVSNDKVGDPFHPPAGIVLTQHPGNVTQWRIQIDADAAFASCSEDGQGKPGLREPVHYGGGDEGCIYPNRKQKPVMPDAYKGLVLECEVDLGPLYPKYKFGGDGKDMSLKIQFTSGWNTVAEKEGFAHRNVSKEGTVSITSEKDGMYASQSPFAALARNPQKGNDWDSRKMNIVQVARHLVMLLENPFMINCG